MNLSQITKFSWLDVSWTAFMDNHLDIICRVKPSFKQIDYKLSIEIEKFRIIIKRMEEDNWNLFFFTYSSSSSSDSSLTLSCLLFIFLLIYLFLFIYWMFGKLTSRWGFRRITILKLEFNIDWLQKLQDQSRLQWVLVNLYLLF